jgi:TPR repeat protein
VTLVTLAAAAALYILNLLYTRETGLYHFVDSNIPIAVFLGLHLLVTDPATSPKTTFGKLLFGAMYGAGVFGIYAALTRLGAPTFYDKLLMVPPLNLLAQALDRAGSALSSKLRPLRWGGSWSPRQLNYGHMACWVALFSTMMTTGFVSGRHPGSDPEFWRRACEQSRPTACVTWKRTVSLMCQHESARACFALGFAASEGRLVPRDPYEADRDFGRACDLGDPYACVNLIKIVETDGQDPLLDACRRGDGESCFILGSLYHAGQGVPKDDAGALALFRRACERGWWRGCARLAESYRSGQGIAADPAQAIEYFEKACRAGHAPSCFNAGDMYRGMNNGALAQQRVRQGCDISVRYAESRAAYFRPGSRIESLNTPAICSQPHL